MRRPLSWKPRRKGMLYCSPACGAKCTIVMYRYAKRMAERLAKELGPGWKPYVHENMGWFWGAESKEGHWYVSPSLDHIHGKNGFPKVLSYSAFLGENHAGIWAAMDDDPREAIRIARQQAIDTVKLYMKMIAEDV